MRKLFKVLTSRLLWSVLAFILQFAVIAYFVIWASYYKGYFYFFFIFSILMGFVVFTRPEKPAYKTVWIFLICIFPLYGAVLYFLMANKKLGYFSRKKTAAFHKSLPREDSFQRNADEELYSISPEFRKLSLFVRNSTGMSAWKDTECRYFEYADAFFIDLLEEVRNAKRFIFIEYFIIGEGRWWSRILEELEAKVKQGVDVRLIYDDMGSINSIPNRYDRKLREKGIIIRKTDIIAIAVTDAADSFFEAADVLGNAGVNIEYGYAYTGRTTAAFFVRVDDPEKAVVVLKDAGIKLILDSEI